MKQGFVKHLAVSLLGASAARGLSFATLPLAARLYSKDDFGGLALALGFVGIALPLLTFRYEIAVVLVRSVEAARSLLCGLIGTAVIAYVVITLLVIGAPELLAGVIDPNLMASLRAPVLLHLAAGILNVSMTAWLQRNKEFATIAVSQFAGALVTSILVLGAPFIVEPSLPMLVWAYAAGVSSTVVVLAVGTAGTGLFAERRSGAPRRVLRLLGKYRVYPTFSLPLTLSSLLSDRLLLLYLSTAFSLGTLGGFYAVRQLLFGLVHLVTSSINQVVFSHLSQMTEGVVSARRPLLTMARGIAGTTGVGLGWLCLHSTELTRILLGDRWIEVAGMMPWIAAHGAAVSVIGWQGRVLDVERRQRLDAVLQMAGDLALVAGISALWLLPISPTNAVATVSTIGIMHSHAWLIIAYRATGLGVRQAFDCELLLFASAVAAAAVAFLSKLAFGNVAGMMVSFAISACCMTVIVFVTAKSINEDACWQALPAGRSWRRELDV